MQLLYVVSEAVPFVKTGGLADVSGSLPKALSAQGADVRVMLPLYSAINEEWRKKMEFCFYTFVPLGWRKQYCGVFKLKHEGVLWYFLDNEYYFWRESLYGAYDDGERFAFFSKAVLEVLPQLGWKPDVINCNDWQTALIPIYLKQARSDFYADVKSVFTIHNIEYQGRFGKDILGDVFGLSDTLYNSGLLRYNNDVNLMKGAIYEADRVSTVSPSYADELLDPYFACGLHNVIAENSHKLTGILNGLDTARHNPMTDPLLAENYGPKSPAGKAVCRAALCREVGITDAEDAPIIGCISRLVGHKGFDLVAEALDRLVERGAKFVLLGTGDERYENYFREAENRYKGAVSANILYAEKRASMIYAGADMILMPSKSEPCGLTQMIAMRYGTVPVVHAVGGLRDSVRPYPDVGANGFCFYDYSADDMLRVIDFAIETWRKPEIWKELVSQDMREDLSWARSAEAYLRLYAEIVSNT